MATSRRRKKTKVREASLLATDFIRRAESLERTRLKAESLYLAGHFAKRDVAYIYEAIFLSLMTRFELLLEELFFGLLMGRRTSGDRRVRGKITTRSEVVMRQILLSGSHYLTWIPYRQTLYRASYYLSSGLPFSSLDDGERSFLAESVYIRNAVAHKSRHALNQFQKVGGVSRLPPRERTPAGFLRSQFRAAPAQSRYENVAANLGAIATKLCR